MTDELNKNRQIFLDTTRDWTQEQLQFKPSEEAWNALQVMEHVMTSEFGTLKYMKKKTKAPSTEIPVATEENKHASGQLNNALKSDKKWVAPDVLPDPTGQKSREELVQFWNVLSQKLDSFVTDLPIEYHDKQVFKHPFAGRLNLEQTLSFLSNHYTHHVHQLRRLEESFGK